MSYVTHEMTMHTVIDYKKYIIVITILNMQLSLIILLFQC